MALWTKPILGGRRAGKSIAGSIRLKSKTRPERSGRRAASASVKRSESGILDLRLTSRSHSTGKKSNDRPSGASCVHCPTGRSPGDVVTPTCSRPKSAGAYLMNPRRNVVMPPTRFDSVSDGYTRVTRTGLESGPNRTTPGPRTDAPEARGEQAPERASFLPAEQRAREQSQG